MLEPLSQVLPHIAVISAVAAFLGWMVRGLTTKPAPAKATPASEKSQPDRAKNLEASLEKSRAAHKAVKAELESLQSASVPKATHDSILAELENARKSLESESRRISAMEADFKKAQDAIKQLNARANEVDKAQKARSFDLENELSKTREQLAILQNRPDDSAGLTAEIERLRESVAVSTRFAGEVRKREAAAVEALEKAEAKLAELSDPSRPATVSKKIGPVVESGRIAAAKAEVLRLVEMNRQKETAAVTKPAIVAAGLTIEAIEPVAEALEPVMEAIEPVAAMVEPVVEQAVEKVVEVVEHALAETREPAPVEKKTPVPAELFSLD